MWSNTMFPSTFAGSRCLVMFFCSSISGSSKNSKTLSEAAVVVCKFVIPWAICVKGPVNKRMYIMNATITPNVMFPFIVNIAPTTQTAT